MEPISFCIISIILINYVAKKNNKLLEDKNNTNNLNKANENKRTLDITIIILSSILFILSLLSTIFLSSYDSNSEFSRIWYVLLTPIRILFIPYLYAVPLILFLVYENAFSKRFDFGKNNIPISSYTISFLIAICLTILSLIIISSYYFSFNCLFSLTYALLILRITYSIIFEKYIILNDTYIDSNNNNIKENEVVKFNKDEFNEAWNKLNEMDKTNTDI